MEGVSDEITSSSSLIAAGASSPQRKKATEAATESTAMSVASVAASPASPLPTSLTPSRMMHGSPSPFATTEYDRASARKQRQEAQEKKRREERKKKEAEEAQEAEREARRAAKKAELRRKQEEERKRKREEERKKKEEKAKAAKVAAAKVAAAKAAKDKRGDGGGGGGGGASTGNLGADLTTYIRSHKRDLDKEEKELAKVVKASEDYLSSKHAPARNAAARERCSSKIAQYAAGAFQPMAALSDWAAGELLRLYDTCTSFSKALGLTTFSLEDLVASLNHRHCEVVLVTSISMALLKAILSPVRRTNRNDSLANGRKPVTAKLLSVPLEIGLDTSGDSSNSEPSTSSMAIASSSSSSSSPTDSKASSSNPFSASRSLLPTKPPAHVITHLTHQEVLFHVLVRSSAAGALLNTESLALGSAAENHLGGGQATKRSLWDDHISRAEALKAGLRGLRTTELHSLPMEQKLVLLSTLALMCYESGAIAEEIAERLDQRVELMNKKEEVRRSEKSAAEEKRKKLRALAVEALKKERKAKDAEDNATKQKTMDQFMQQKSAGSASDLKGMAAGSEGSPSGGAVDSLAGAAATAPPTKKPPPKKSSSSGSLTSDGEKAEADASSQGPGPASSTDGDAAGKKPPAKEKKEWHPSHQAIGARVKELEEGEMYKDIRVRPLSDLELEGGALERAQENLIKAYEEAEEAEVESEDEDILRVKLSRTQLIERRNAREERIRKSKDKVARCEEYASSLASRSQVLEDIEKALNPPKDNSGGGGGGSSGGNASTKDTAPLTARAISLLIRAGEKAQLEGRDDQGDWCVPCMRELHRRLHSAKAKEKAARKEAAHVAALNNLLVRQEPLAAITADLSKAKEPFKDLGALALSTSLEGAAAAASSSSSSSSSSLAPSLTATGANRVIMSFWSFGKGFPSVGGKDKTDKRNQRLWMRVHSPLNPAVALEGGTGSSNNLSAMTTTDGASSSSSSSSPPAASVPESAATTLSSRFPMHRWTYIDQVPQLRAFYNIVSNHMPPDAVASAAQLQLRDQLMVHYNDALADDSEDENEEVEDVDWRVEGSEYVGRKVKLVYDHGRKKVVTIGIVVGWVPAEENRDSEEEEGLALWHVRHEDGDEEDLEEHEVTAAIEAYETSDEKAAFEEKEANRLAREAAGEDPMDFDDDEDKPWRAYVNKAGAKADRIREEDLGLTALGKDLLKKEDLCVDGIKERVKSKGAGKAFGEWTKGRGNESVLRASWRNEVSSASSVAQMRGLFKTFEELLHSFQEVEDPKEGDDQRRQMIKAGWLFGVNMTLDGKPDPVNGLPPTKATKTDEEQADDMDVENGGLDATVASSSSSSSSSVAAEPSEAAMDTEPTAAAAALASAAFTAQQPHPFVGVMVRRFFDGSESDGKIIAWLPPSVEVGEEEEGQALWHMMHSDGDEEDLEEGEALKAMWAFHDGLHEPDDDSDDEAVLDEAGEDEEEEDNLQDSEEEDEEESEESEDEEEDDMSKRTLWPSWGSRESWHVTVRSAETVGELAVALELLHEAALKFGIASDNSSKEGRALEKARGKRGSLLSHFGGSFGLGGGGYVGRKASAAARAKIKGMAEEDASVDDATGARKRKRASAGKMTAAKSPQGKKHSSSRSRGRRR